MRFYSFIIILPLLWWACEARAQLPEEAASSVPEQWQLTLDVIKSKAQSLMLQNKGLQLEYNSSMEQVQQLQQQIEEQRSKNEQTQAILKQRHGTTDQQLRIEELTQGLKTKREQLRDLDGQLQAFDGKQEALERKIQQLKRTVSNLTGQEQSATATPVPPTNDGRLDQLRKELDEENAREASLQNILKGLKDALPLSGGNKYSQLKERQEQLMAGIGAYELRLNELRESSLKVLSWPVQKKRLVHELALTDACNNQIRANIKILHEDIDVLKDQVARLERRLDFAQGENK